MTRSAPLRVRFWPGESAKDLLRRLALRNGFPQLPSFIHEHLGGSRAFERFSSERGIREVALLSGGSFKSLQADTIQVQFDGRVVLRGEEVGLSERRYKAGLRVCPECISQDKKERRGPISCRASVRSWWQLSHIHACPVHCCLLLRACTACGAGLDQRHTDCSRCFRCRSDLGTMANEIPAADCIASAYLIGRLGAARPVRHPLLDGMPWWAAGVAMIHLGQAATAEKPRGSPRAMARLASTGFRLTADWPNDFNTLLDDLRARHPNSHASRAYGHIYQWLMNSNEEWATCLREPLQAHILKHSPITERASWWNEGPGRGEWLRHETAQRRSGLKRGHFAKAIEAIKQRVGDEAVPHLVHRSALDEIMGEYGDLISAICAAELLGISLYLLKQMISDGLLEPALPFKRRSRLVFRRTQLVSFVTELSKHANVQSNGPEDEGLVSLVEACRSESTLTQRVRAVQSGSLTVRGVRPGASGLQQLLVRASEVPRTHRLGASAAAVQAYLGLDRMAFLAAIRHGLLPKLARGGPMPLIALNAFDLEYVSLGALRASLRRAVPSRWISRVLEEEGVTPVCVAAAGRGYIFRRAAAEDALSKRFLVKAS